MGYVQVRRLLASSDVNLVGVPRADAYVAVHPYLTKLVLPMGVGNFAANRPAADVNLVAPEASLLVRRDLHPAIQYLLLDAASEIHATPGIFQRPGQFPAPEEEDLPLSKEASRYYKSGDPSAALSALLGCGPSRTSSRSTDPDNRRRLSLAACHPSTHGWTMRRRIFWLYGELRSIEIEFETEGNRAKEDMLARLNGLEERADHLARAPGFRHLALYVTPPYRHGARPLEGELSLGLAAHPKGYCSPSSW